MIKEELVEQKQVVRASLLKRHENLVVFSIFVGFVVIIVLLQLIMGEGTGFPPSSAP